MKNSTHLNSVPYGILIFKNHYHLTVTPQHVRAVSAHLVNKQKVN